jgi:3'(2'), 5'-bisphosphate nucleotidase
MTISIDNRELSRLAHALTDLSQRAGAEILEVYAGDANVTRKTDDSPLTEADLRSHRAIVAGLKQLTGDLPILSEESAEIPFEERARWSSYWLVDPLDGTKEFISRNGEFTVNIALISDGQPVLGVVYVPVTATTYVGARGSGAWKTVAGETRPISTRRPAPSPVRVVGSRSHRGDLIDAYLAKLGPHELLPFGSSLKLCMVAEGSADLYPRLGPTCEWDTAAAHAVVLGAGGAVVDVSGAPLTYNKKAEYLNPHFIVFGDATRDWLGPLR